MALLTGIQGVAVTLLVATGVLVPAGELDSPERPAQPVRTSEAAGPGATAQGDPTAGCDRFAAPRGSDRNRGTRRRPFRTVPRLTSSLRRGQTGCLLPGTYRHREVARLRRPRSTLRGIGPRPARILNPIWILPRATGAQLLTVHLTTTSDYYTEPLKVQADRARVIGNTITGGANASCILVGSQRTTHGVVIARNRIRNCGRHGKLDHLIYLEHTRATRVRLNLLTDNRGGWALHLYPDADGTIVERNLIDGNLGGVIFAGDGDDADDMSERNLVRYNAITNSGPRWNIETSWGGSSHGEGNVVHSNCVFSTGPDAPSGLSDEDELTIVGNTVLDGSPYVNRRRRDYRFREDSPCRALVGDPIDELESRTLYESALARD